MVLVVKVGPQVQEMQETQETQAQSLGQEDPLEEEMAPHSSILAGKIPRAEESGGPAHAAAENWTQLTTTSPWSFSPQSEVKQKESDKKQAEQVG